MEFAYSLLGPMPGSEGIKELKDHCLKKFPKLNWEKVYAGWQSDGKRWILIVDSIDMDDKETHDLLSAAHTNLLREHSEGMVNIHAI